MKVLTKENRTGKISINDVPTPNLPNGFVLVRNHFSAISPGTERASLSIAKKNLLEKARSRPEDLKKVFKLIEQKGIIEAYNLSMRKLSLPSPLGYSSSDRN